MINDFKINYKFRNLEKRSNSTIDLCFKIRNSKNFKNLNSLIVKTFFSEYYIN